MEKEGTEKESDGKRAKYWHSTLSQGKESGKEGG